MLFTQGKINLMLSETLKQQADIIRDQRKIEEKYNAVLRNICEARCMIHDDRLYVRGEKVYYIYQERFDENTEICVQSGSYFTYCLDDAIYNPNVWVCKSEFEVRNGKCGKTLYLDCIDTGGNSRQGHGSMQIKVIVDHARAIGAAKIKGELKADTCIGIDNLRHFYEKNGFQITENNFVMML